MESNPNFQRTLNNVLISWNETTMRIFISHVAKKVNQYVFVLKHETNSLTTGTRVIQQSGRYTQTFVSMPSIDCQRASSSRNVSGTLIDFPQLQVGLIWNILTVGGYYCGHLWDLLWTILAIVAIKLGPNGKTSALLLFRRQSSFFRFHWLP